MNNTFNSMGYSSTTVNYHSSGINVTGFSNQTTLSSNISSTFVPELREDHVPAELIRAHEIFVTYVSFGIWILAFPANILIILVLVQRKERTSSINIYFISLAVADLLVNCRTLVFWLDKQHIITYTNDIGCQLSKLFPVFAMVSSSWSLAIISFERMIGVSKPHKVRLLCTKTIAKIFVVLIWIAAFSLGIVNAIFFYSENRSTCAIEKEKLIFFLRYIVRLDFTFDIALPFVIILINSLIIACCLVKSMRMANSSNSRTSGFSISGIVLSINIGFFVTQFPYGVMYLYQQANTFDQSPERRVYLTYIETIALVLKYMNSGLNFYLYFLTGSKFRRDTKNFFSSVKQTCCSSGDRNNEVTRTTRSSLSTTGIHQEVSLEIDVYM